MGSRLIDFLRRFMASKSHEAAQEDNAAAAEYKGYTIRPQPRRQGSQWLTAGVITKHFPDGVKERQFVRADTHGAKSEADVFSVDKAKQIIDELGDKLFDRG